MQTKKHYKYSNEKEFSQIKSMLTAGISQSIVSRALNRSSAFISQVSKFKTMAEMKAYTAERSKKYLAKKKGLNVFTRAPVAPGVTPVLPSDKMIALLSEIVNELVLIRKTVSNGKTVIEKF